MQIDNARKRQRLFVLGLTVCFSAGALLMPAAPVAGEEKPTQPDITRFANGPGEWTLKLGKEFPGAQAALSREPLGQNGAPVLRLEGYFAAGGNYVGLHREFAQPVPLREMIVRLSAPRLRHLTVRVIAANGTAHQQTVALDETALWQTLTIRNFAPANATHYHSWGGDGTKKWDGMACAVTLILDRNAIIGKDRTKEVLLLDEIRLRP